ncbi:hypothetical protein AJ80_08863 [Polytolypa hystricis UAMH7299]|uniref:Ketoreductase (KR) domain-containing protein n=1 Tax=Polytolypa hystricis (strain UAMH7299) TaxID=1447883 RepID=A0A2B7X0M7_POLH7|nr:hypothetical protein AJ80_08863 [Polytolypa hystricis UAMH7299]
MALTGTAIITSGDGPLGSSITLEFAKRQPRLHLLLVTRDPSSASVKQVCSRVRLLGAARSLETVPADLSKFSSILSFADATVARVRSGEIPPIAVLVNCAGTTTSYELDGRTVEGFDRVYQVNCLAPFLLTVSLLEGFRAGSSRSSTRSAGPRPRTATATAAAAVMAPGACVVNVGCSAMTPGNLEFFESDWEKGREVGTQLGGKEGLKRFGSSKLLMSVAMYALRRSFLAFGHIPLDICTVDPGHIQPSPDTDTDTQRGKPRLQITQRTRTGLSPVLRLFSKTAAVNEPRVPAKAIVEIACRHSNCDNESSSSGSGGGGGGGGGERGNRCYYLDNTERYYILDDEYEAGSVINVLRDGKIVDNVFQRVMRQVGMADGTKTTTPPPEMI